MFGDERFIVYGFYWELEMLRLFVNGNVLIFFFVKNFYLKKENLSNMIYFLKDNYNKNLWGRK